MKINLPKVSVLIISYNQEEVIRETLNSIISQTYQNWEICIADDASTDATQHIIKECQSQYPDKIKIYLSETNKGITKNTRNALKLCTGDFIALCGGDDVFLPHKIEEQIKWFDKNPKAVVCYHDVMAFDSTTNKDLFLFSQNHPPISGNIHDTLASCDIFACACSVMLRVIPDTVFDFPLELPYSSDWYSVLSHLAKTKGEIGYVDGIHARYRRNFKNITQCKNLADEMSHLFLLLGKKFPSLKNKCQFVSRTIYLGEIFNSLKRLDFTSALKCLYKGRFAPLSFLKALHKKIKIRRLRIG